MTTISTTDFTDGVTSRTSAALDTNFANCATVLTGNVDNANFASDAGIDVAKLGGGSDGQVFARQGGVNAWVGGWVQIANVQLAGTATSIDFTNIPQSFWKLHLLCYLRGDDSVVNGGWGMRFNGDTGGNYYHGAMASSSAGFAFSQSQAATSFSMGLIPMASATSGFFGVDEVVIVGSNQTKLKTMHQRGGLHSSAVSTGTTNNRRGGTWNSTVAITSISLFPGAGNFVAGSRIVLLGVS